MIQFKAKYLKALLPFTVANDIRYYLAGIHIEPAEAGGAFLVATDGHTMIVIHDKTAICTEPAIIKVQKEATKYSTGMRQIFGSLHAITEADVLVNPYTKRLSIHANGFELYIQAGNPLLDGKFPKWQTVLPDFANLKPASSGCINPMYVQRAAQVRVGSSNLDKYYQGIRIWSTGDPQATQVVQFLKIPEAFALLMPMRFDDKELEWAPVMRDLMTKPQEPAPAKAPELKAAA